MESNAKLMGRIEQKDGKWCAFLQLETPDGRVSKMNTGYIFNSSSEAEEALRATTDQLLQSFTEDGGSIVSKNGKTLQ